MSIELVMPSNHFVLGCHLLLLPSIFPSIRVFSNKSVLHIRWPKYCSFSITPSDEYRVIYIWWQVYLFPFKLDTFLVFLRWQRMPILCWTEAVTVGIFVLFQNQWGGFQHFTLECSVGCELALSCWDMVPHWWVFFFFFFYYIMNIYWKLSNAFSASIQMIMEFLSFLVNVVYHVDWFVC